LPTAVCQRATTDAADRLNRYAKVTAISPDDAAAMTQRQADLSRMPAAVDRSLTPVIRLGA
jgi:hypothetical protein